jgi:hypothetical protein
MQKNKTHTHWSLVHLVGAASIHAWRIHSAGLQKCNVDRSTRKSQQITGGKKSNHLNARKSLGHVLQKVRLKSMSTQLSI